MVVSNPFLQPWMFKTNSVDCLFAVKHIRSVVSLSLGADSTDWQDRSGNTPPAFTHPGGPPLTHPRNPERKTERKSKRLQKQRKASLSHYASKLHNSLFFLSSEFVFLWTSDIWIIVWYPSVRAWGDRKKTTTHKKLRPSHYRKKKHTHNMVNVFVFSFIPLSSLFFIHASFSSQST